MRKTKRSKDEGYNVWRSFSDLMAGILLLFVLIMCVTLFQAQKSYDESIKERDEKLALQEQYTAEILEQQLAITEQEGQLKDQDEKLKTQSEKLKSQEEKLAELAAQMAAQKVVLDEKTELLTQQQQKIDNIIGVKADVVESLRQEFANNNINVDIDSQTGALTLDANVMFDYDDYELTDEGEAALRKVLPIYCKVLLEDKHKEYLAEIIIAGYTDPDGDYSYNLQLSQMRSLAVAQYLIDIQGEFLSENESIDLKNYLTVNGHSTSHPILDENGNIDKDASRRVEVKFRLKDDEMIDELNTIMSN